MFFFPKKPPFAALPAAFGAGTPGSLAHTDIGLDVKNILVLENGSTMRRKEMKVNTLNINALYENLYFPMLARMTIKKT